MSSQTKTDICNRALLRIGEQSIEDVDTDQTFPGEVCRLAWDDIVIGILEMFPWPFATKQAKLENVDTITETFDGDGATSEIPISAFYTRADMVTVVQEVIATGATTTLESGTDYTLTMPSETVIGSVTLAAGALPVTDRIVITIDNLRTGWDHVYTLPGDCALPICLLAASTRPGILASDQRAPFDLQSNEAGNGKWLFTDMASDDIEAIEYVANVSVSAYPRAFVDVVVWALVAELYEAIRKDPLAADRARAKADIAFAAATAAELNARQDDTVLESSTVRERFK